MTLSIRLRSLPFVVAALVATPVAAQQPTFLDLQRQVNNVTASDQRLAAVAKSPDGTTWVVWESWTSAGGDADGRSIQMRRYAAHGQVLGAQVQVNTTTAGHQSRPAVASDPVTGAVMVVWESPGAGGGAGADVRARIYLPNGTAAGADFPVNLFTTGDQLLPAVAGELGGFVVIWQSDDDPGAGVDWNIAGRAFDATGSPITGELLINDQTAGAQEVPAIDARGEQILAVWQSATSSGSDNTTSSIQGRWIVGGWGPDAFQVNEHPPVMSDYNPAVAVRPNGAAVVVWDSFGSIGDDADRYAVQGRVFSPTGVPGAQFQVNAYTDDDQRFPAVVVDSDGKFVAAWQSYGSSGNDADGWSVQVRAFAPDGTPLGGDRQANHYVVSDQMAPALAIDGAGRIALAWESLGSPGDDDSLFSVQVRRLTLRLLFADGFATGDTSRWSLTAP